MFVINCLACMSFVKSRVRSLLRHSAVEVGGCGSHHSAIKAVGAGQADQAMA